MGPNWELISDAMNSALKIKVNACYFEKLWDSSIDFTFCFFSSEHVGFVTD